MCYHTLLRVYYSNYSNGGSCCWMEIMILHILCLILTEKHCSKKVNLQYTWLIWCKSQVYSPWSEFCGHSNLFNILLNYGFCLKVGTHPSTNPTRPSLTSELVCLLSLFLAKVFSQHHPPIFYSVFSLFPRFASYCKYRISN